MYLKTLELFGFKSFAERTVVQFHEGITAIVGPNGCGKSNILDAVKWVLGEQSAKALRGDGMVDVIFNGTDDRRPLNMAEISLTFAECERELGVEWNEVRVSRRLHRDGKSEYLLNNSPCRLRDIQNLFMDTGIGRSAYSIMEQGKIDQILSSHPEQRRAVFEEAAGITKYKTQKKEALRKLEHTEANLIRITDILREVKRQIGSLQRQAGKARRYKALQNDLQILDTHLGKRRFDTLDTELAEAVREMETLTEQIDELSSGVNTREQDVVSKRLALEEIELRAMSARERAQELRNLIANAEVRIGFNRERNIELNALIRRHTEEITESEGRYAERSAELERLESEIQVESIKSSDADGEVAAKTAFAEEARARRSTVEREFDRLRSNITGKEQTLFRLKNELASFLNQREAIDARVAALDHEIQALRDSIERAKERANEQESALAEKKTEFEQANLRVSQTQTTLAESTNALRQAEASFASASRELQTTELRRESLEQLNREGAGLNESSQAILAANNKDPDLAGTVVGALGTLIETEPHLIPAIEAALGNGLHCIAATDPSAFQRILSSLGRLEARGASIACAGLFPTQKQKENISLPSEAKPLRQAVRAPDPVSRILDALLADTWLVASIDDALRLRQSHVATFVTPQGELISRSGIFFSASGDSSGRAVLQRKNLIAELSEKTASIHSELAKKEKARELAAATVADAQQRLEEAKTAAQEVRLQVSTIEGQLGEVRRELRSLADRLASLEREREQNSARIVGLVERHSSVAATVNAESSALDSLRRQIETFTASIENARADEDLALSNLNDLRVKAAEARQRVEGLRRQRDPLRSRIAELRSLIDTRAQEIETFKARIAAHDRENATLQEAIAAHHTELSQVDAQISEILSEREAAAAAITALETDLREARNTLDALRKNRGEQEVRQTTTRLQIQNLNDQIVSRYQIELADFSPDTYALLKTLESINKSRSKKETDLADQNECPKPTDTAANEKPNGDSDPATTRETGIDWEQIESLVIEMRQKLDSMGPVNLDAIEEFEELEQRQQFLELQNNDLLKAKSELLEAIAKINKTTEELFAETFQRLRENFGIMFRELFGGGRADLALMDSDDPLECGIEIIARPPGKQPQSISLLSGGERAMTALALLFAIYMVKPSPFCVLDEMDAPLDDSNINRFIRILERFTEQSQFVVISHNKRTIARADYLYGVTMEQKGVSKLIGMRFTRADDTTASSTTFSAAGSSINDGETPGISEVFGKSSNILSEQTPQH